MCVSAACLREGLRHIRQTNVSCLLVRLSLFSTIYFLFFLMLLFTFLHSPFFSLLSSFLLLFSFNHFFVLPYYTFSALCMQPSLWFWHRLFSCLLFLFLFFFAKLLLSLSFAPVMRLLLLRTSQSPHATAKFGDLSFSRGPSGLFFK